LTEVFLLVAGSLSALAIVVHEVRNWRRPGPRKLPNAHDAAGVGEARYRSGFESGGSMGGGVNGGGFGAGS
jgi:hypothetical protein